MIDLNNPTAAMAAQLERERWALMLASDIEASAALLSDDVVYIHSNGLRDDKGSFLRKFRDGVFVYHSATPEVDTVSQLGADVLIANGTLRMHATVNGVDRHMHSAFSVVWQRETGTWRLALLQTTPIPSANA
jgi:ketosteroid isomerase-like protein